MEEDSVELAFPERRASLETDLVGTEVSGGGPILLRCLRPEPSGKAKIEQSDVAWSDLYGNKVA